MAFLSAGPWGRPNGAPHFGVCRFKNSEGSDHNRRACRIIGSAGSGMPGIEMCAEHDEFVGFVGSGNFADDVERIQIIIVELVLDIHFDSNRNLLVQHSPDPAIVLHGHNDLRWNGRIVRIPATATLNEYGAAAALSGFDGGDHTLIQKKLQAPLIEILRIVSTACARCGATLSRPWKQSSEFQSDRKSTRLNSSHGYISYAVFCLKKKKAITTTIYYLRS